MPRVKSEGIAILRQNPSVRYRLQTRVFPGDVRGLLQKSSQPHSDAIVQPESKIGGALHRSHPGNQLYPQHCNVPKQATATDVAMTAQLESRDQLDLIKCCMTWWFLSKFHRELTGELILEPQ